MTQIQGLSQRCVYNFGYKCRIHQRNPTNEYDTCCFVNRDLTDFTSQANCADNPDSRQVKLQIEEIVKE